MKLKTFFAGILICSVFALTAPGVNAQDPKGTFLEESGEAQDSTKVSDILDYELVDGNEKSNTGLIIGIVAVVLIGGGIIIFLRNKKK
ncbi:MAG: LPXTG cell wall anchor domain-containing protein [Bacteroidales bacterium]|nr:LPXTG cell wall anchor domain-containing protein [Bacteroidales bacterium]